MEAEGDIEGDSVLQKTIPLGPIDSRRARFPCCIVWTPLPFISWLIPFIGHVGICREDGVILDFAGPNFVSVDNFAFGAVARYLPLDRSKEEHSGVPAQIYNLFTCNCHSFVANSLNHLSYGGREDWNLVNLAAWIFLGGRWVDRGALLRSLSPFPVLLLLGFLLSGVHLHDRVASLLPCAHRLVLVRYVLLQEHDQALADQFGEREREREREREGQTELPYGDCTIICNSPII
ncbi:unnamed protein product [Spirodela intermedia]|uniref:Uncharacterized protein n=1 Tax=Spirodela intermedia TaxID=51605 RepID=A0A7I8IP63_SPIIN|nr:unnamed protein product [Spirodela intermedia]CAA6658931.1 unnamed protein product [Spirodela intermedia]